MTDKSDARISLGFYIRDGLANRAHVTGTAAGEKAEIVVEDVISNLLDPSALRAVMDCAREQGIEVPPGNK